MGEASEKQFEANRRNAERSTGPRTAEGKARSRANGLKHGLAAEILIPEGDRAAYEATLARWEHQAGPDNIAEHHLIRRAAVASVTIDRLDTARESTRQEAARDAVRRWERRKQHATRRKAQDLKSDPGGTVADLEGTAFGCDWLIRQWEALDGPLAAGMAWEPAQLAKAQRMLGYPDGRPGIDAERPIRVLWLLAGAMAPSSIGNLPRTTAEAAMPNEPAAARTQLRRFVAAEVERLEESRAEAWEAVEGPEYRAVVIRAAAADTTEEGRLRHRYATDADRSHNAAMRLFYRARGLRRQEYLAIAKEGRQSGRIPRVPVGGGWWREVDSDPSPPGYARVDPIAAARAPEAGETAGEGSSALPGGATPAAVDPVPPTAGAAVSASPAVGPRSEADPLAPTGPADRPAPAVASGSEAPRRSEPNSPSGDKGESVRKVDCIKELRRESAAEPINVPWRTEPLATATGGPGSPASAADPRGAGRPAGGRPGLPGAPRRSEPNPTAGDAGDPGRNPFHNQRLGCDAAAGPIGDPRRTEPLPDADRPGGAPGRRPPDLATSRRRRRPMRRR